MKKFNFCIVLCLLMVLAPLAVQANGPPEGAAEMTQNILTTIEIGFEQMTMDAAVTFTAPPVFIKNADAEDQFLATDEVWSAVLQAAPTIKGDIYTNVVAIDSARQERERLEAAIGANTRSGARELMDFDTTTRDTWDVDLRRKYA